MGQTFAWKPGQIATLCLGVDEARTTDTMGRSAEARTTILKICGVVRWLATVEDQRWLLGRLAPEAMTVRQWRKYREFRNDSGSIFHKLDSSNAQISADSNVVVVVVQRHARESQV